MELRTNSRQKEHLGGRNQGLDSRAGLSFHTPSHAGERVLRRPATPAEAKAAKVQPQVDEGDQGCKVSSDPALRGDVCAEAKLLV